MPCQKQGPVIKLHAFTRPSMGRGVVYSVTYVVHAMKNSVCAKNKFARVAHMRCSFAHDIDRAAFLCEASLTQCLFVM